jgi:hypothetical protein
MIPSLDTCKNPLLLTGLTEPQEWEVWYSLSTHWCVQHKFLCHIKSQFWPELLHQTMVIGSSNVTMITCLWFWMVDILCWDLGPYQHVPEHQPCCIWGLLTHCCILACLYKAHHCKPLWYICDPTCAHGNIQCHCIISWSCYSTWIIADIYVQRLARVLLLSWKHT